MSAQLWPTLKSAFASVFGQASPSQGSIRFIGGGNGTTNLENLLDTTSGVVPYYNPYAYGCKGDGVTDDTAAFQAMLDAAYTSATSSPLDAQRSLCYLPPGQFAISNTLTIGRNVYVVGESEILCQIVALSGFPASTPMIRLDRPADTTICQYLRLWNVTIYGDSGNGGSGVDTCVYAESLQEQHPLHAVSVGGFVNYGFRLRTNSGAQANYVCENFHLSDLGVAGTKAAASSRGISLEGCTGANVIERVSGYMGNAATSTLLYVDSNSFAVLNAIHAEECMDGIAVLGNADVSLFYTNNQVTNGLHVLSGGTCSWRQIWNQSAGGTNVQDDNAGQAQGALVGWSPNTGAGNNSSVLTVATIANFIGGNAPNYASIKFNNPLVAETTGALIYPAQCMKASLPSGYAGAVIFVTDHATGSGLCVYNGSNWIDVTTGNPVS